MNNVEIDDIYHYDFTTASGWEVFIARIEEMIHEWKLSEIKSFRELKEGDFNLKWEKYSKQLDNYYFLECYRLKIEDENSELDSTLSLDYKKTSWTQCQNDILNARNDFIQLDQDMLKIVEIYGIREFILLKSVSKDIRYIPETTIKVLLSSLSIALINTHCEVAAFVQNLSRFQNRYFYQGVNIGRKAKIHFNMFCLVDIPSHCKHLTGLLTLFKEKIGEGFGLKVEPVLVSARLGYAISHMPTWTAPPSLYYVFRPLKLYPLTDVELFKKFMFGADLDPILGFHLCVSWSEICENNIIDSEDFSDLEPLTAPEWSLKIHKCGDKIYLLSGCLSFFLENCSNQRKPVLKVNVESQSLSSAFDILTEPKIPSISTIFSRTTSKFSKNHERMIEENDLIALLYFLFPDAEEESRTPYDDKNNYNVDDDQWKGVKTCVIDGLVWRLAIVFGQICEPVAIEELWCEFVQELRFRWEKCIPIPGVAPGFPDCVRTCLLHQKLQMLNCCIAQRKKREEDERKEQERFMDIEVGESNGDSEEDEFFECLSEEASKNSALEQPPVGRLAKHPSLRLVKTGEPLYIPITLDPVPKTEDQLEEDARVMMQLGTDDNASMMRARLMSASLLSDMQSFKAANPKALFDDFIKWYSPHDWIPDEGLNEWGQPSGHLSQRMLIENNPWTSTWESATPVPAHHQKRLFDDTCEAEKILFYLDSCPISEVSQLLLPAVMHVALKSLIDRQAKDPLMPAISSQLEKLRNSLQIATSVFLPNLEIYKKIQRNMENIEIYMVKISSLRLKFGLQDGEPIDDELITFINSLSYDKYIPVPGGPNGPIRARIAKIFYKRQKEKTKGIIEADAAEDAKLKTFGTFSFKEFILRTTSSRSWPYSTPQPHRLHVHLTSQHSILMAGAFSEDTLFY